MSATEALRARTAADHERVDAAFARFDLADRAAYRAMLLAHAGALAAVERVLVAHNLLGRERMPALAADLTALDAPLPPPLPFELDAAGAHGALYVSEGSRLGGGLIARGVPGDLPSAYLRDVHLPGEWRAIRQRINAAAQAHDAAWLDAAIAGANATFALYERAAKG